MAAKIIQKKSLTNAEFILPANNDVVMQLNGKSK